jgi:hypothetical protein
MKRGVYFARSTVTQLHGVFIQLALESLTKTCLQNEKLNRHVPLYHKFGHLYVSEFCLLHSLLQSFCLFLVFLNNMKRLAQRTHPSFLLPPGTSDITLFYIFVKYAEGNLQKSSSKLDFRDYRIGHIYASLRA